MCAVLCFAYLQTWSDQLLLVVLDTHDPRAHNGVQALTCAYPRQEGEKGEVEDKRKCTADKQRHTYAPQREKKNQKHANRCVTSDQVPSREKVDARTVQALAVAAHQLRRRC